MASLPTTCWAVGKLVAGLKNAHSQGLVNLLDQLQEAAPPAVLVELERS